MHRLLPLIDLILVEFCVFDRLLRRKLALANGNLVEFFLWLIYRDISH